MDTQVILPAWYESTSGPAYSQTLVNIVGNFLPVVNMFFASKGHAILPEQINGWISLAVFVFFSVRAALGYVKAKANLGKQLSFLKQENERLGAMLPASRD